MKRNIFIVLFLFGSYFTAYAQAYYSVATAAQQKELIQKITTSSEQMKTLQCNFVQKKTISILEEEMVSEGHLLFKQKDKLCWEYTSPYQYKFTLNGDKIMINSGGNKNVIDINNSKVFKEISKIIVAGINGSGIFEESKFEAKFLVGKSDYQIVLSPKQKELKKLFRTINLCFNKTDYTVNTVTIEEVSGDKTFIQMKNKQINKELSDESFTIR